jgi:hypothetical protein
MTRKTIREPEEPVEEIPAHTTEEVVKPSRVATGDLAEYVIDGRTYLLSEADAKARGAKRHQPRNKAVTPDNK